MEIIWTSQALTDYWSNIDYLDSKWTDKDVISFLNKVDEVIQLLKKDNIHFISTTYKDINKVVVTKQITLFYKKQNNAIFLLRFWNNYQDLKKLKF